MKSVKRLWALCAALIIVWVYSFAASLVVGTDISWYLALEKPFFFPSPQIISIVFYLTYICYVIIFTRIILKTNKKKTFFAVLACLGANLIFLTVFFGFEHLILSLIFSYLLVVTWVIAGFKIAKKDRISNCLFLLCFLYKILLIIFLHVIYFTT